MSAPLLALWERTPHRDHRETIRVFQTIGEEEVMVLTDYAPPRLPMQEVQSLPVLSLGVEMAVWAMEGWHRLRLCPACGGHGWRWVGDRQGEADRDLCPECQGQGGTR